MAETVTVLLFVKGTATSPVEDLIAQAQLAATLDTLDKLRTLPEIGRILVSTANDAFATRAAARGAQVELDRLGPEFHFGRTLAALVAEYDVAVPLYIGGGSGALMHAEDWQVLARTVLREPETLISNNYFSTDFAAWSPGAALARIDPPPLDNDLAFRLGERGGLRVEPLEKNAATQLDIDTPTDLLTLSLRPDVGPELRTVLYAAHLDLSRVRPIQALLRERTATVLIAGRVSASMALFLERATRCEWRIFSEERGMRASGRQARGEVRSLLGVLLDRLGPDEFFATLSLLANAIVLDSRVLFAHRGLQPTAPDRFYSDLLLPEQIEDPFIRAFTAAARAAPVPVLMGGHSLVSGGMYALVET